MEFSNFWLMLGFVVGFFKLDRPYVVRSTLLHLPPDWFGPGFVAHPVKEALINWCFQNRCGQEARAGATGMYLCVFENTT